MSVKLPLARSKYMTIISAYALILMDDEDTKDEFYNALSFLLQSVNREDRLVMMGIFKARVGAYAGV